ncbi:MAG: hypothetical protein ACYS8Z_21500, partial [Planctomycetota bacterium]
MPLTDYVDSHHAPVRRLCCLVALVAATLIAVGQIAAQDYVVKEDTDHAFPVALVDETDFITPETEKKFGDTAVYYSNITDGNTASVYTDDATLWYEIGDGTGDYKLIMGAGEFTDPGKRYFVKVVVAGCETVRFSVFTTYQDPADVSNQIGSIYDKLPTNYIMGSSTVGDQDTIILSGTCPDNTSTADTIKLAPAASGTNDYYNENLVVLVGGTGAGQARLIADYVGAAETAAVRNAWLTTPDNTTQYRIYPFSGILLSNTGLVVAATSDTITLNASAQAVADVYVGHTIFISGGTGLGQARLITAYTAGRVATVSPAWDVTPGAASSIYLVLPVGRTYVDTVGTGAIDDISDGVWDEAV